MTLKLKDLLQGNCPQRAPALMREAFPGDPVVGKMSAKWIPNWNARRAPPPPSTKAELEKWINELEEEQIDDDPPYCFKESVADDGSTFLTCLLTPNPKTSLRSAAQVNTQPGTSQSREALYINKKRFEVPKGYTGNLRHDQQKCDEFWKVIVDDRRKSFEIRLSPANQARAEAFEKLMGQKFSTEQRVFLRVCGQYMEKE